jgi:class 3 adenylate cyclase
LSVTTYESLADPPSAEELPPALVKGRDTPVAAWRLSAVADEPMKSN